jgi:predicted ATP-dependent endonuclease of OLD family
MKRPSYIFIDEPQSFLHPGAARNLIEILKLYSHHQYFITTHSPNIVRVSEPASLTLLSCKNLSSKAETVDKDSLADLKSVLFEVGLKFSDFFGADQILWVEGPTEEKCFPLIIRDMGDKCRKTGKPPGLEILSVISVGDFESKRAELIFDVYDKLGTSSSLLPPAAGFIFDQELRTESKMQDLKKRRPDQVKFIPRRMYENYLLSPGAIAYVLNKHDIHEDKKHSPNEIENWIIDNQSQYSKFPYKTKEWFEKSNAAKLLQDCFREISESRVAFLKTIHSVQLTEWILENEHQQLKELADFLSTTIKELEDIH